MYTLPPPYLPSGQAPGAAIDKQAPFRRAALAIVLAIAAVNAAAWPFPTFSRVVTSRWGTMPPACAAAALLGALSLWMSETQGWRRLGHKYGVSLLLAAQVTLLATIILAGYVMQARAGSVSIPISRAIHFLLSMGMGPGFAGGFALLGLTTILLGARNRASNVAADVIAIALALVVLTVVSEHLLAAWHLLEPSNAASTSSQTIVCLLLLAVTALSCRTQSGALSILLGRGMGSRIARVVAPFLVIVPYLREAGRVRLMEWGRLPLNYTTAILPSVNVVVALAVLLFLAWRINALERQISELAFRDALTGLYNVRGFRFLAEQSLRMARRSQQPFSVLFIDLDDLKHINDLLGHQIGSEFLIETGAILTTTFRETDVVGRIGGDEFAVAGQFTRASVEQAAERLQEAAKRRNHEIGRKIGLRFSIGYITHDGSRHSTLEEMLAKADAAMYEQKRLRKGLMSSN